MYKYATLYFSGAFWKIVEEGKDVKFIEFDRDELHAAMNKLSEHRWEIVVKYSTDRFLIRRPVVETTVDYYGNVIKRD